MVHVDGRRHQSIQFQECDTSPPSFRERRFCCCCLFCIRLAGKRPKLNLLSHINTKLAKWTEGGPGLTPANLFHFLWHSSPFTHWLIKTKISQALSSLRTLEWLSSVFMLWAIHSWLFNVTGPWSLRPHHQRPLLRDTDHLTSNVTPPQYLVIYPSHNLLHFLHNSYN